jgi:hypothetical protein
MIYSFDELAYLLDKSNTIPYDNMENVTIILVNCNILVSVPANSVDISAYHEYNSYIGHYLVLVGHN